MGTAHSRLTAQGQISVPARIRHKLGLAPGSLLEWDDSGDDVLVRRAGRYSSEEIHRSVFVAPPKARTLADLKAGLGRHVKRRHARR
jgi:antitoxin PrlF